MCLNHFWWILLFWFSLLLHIKRIFYFKMFEIRWSGFMNVSRKWINICNIYDVRKNMDVFWHYPSPMNFTNQINNKRSRNQLVCNRINIFGIFFFIRIYDYFELANDKKRKCTYVCKYLISNKYYTFDGSSVRFVSGQIQFYFRKINHWVYSPALVEILRVNAI